MSDATRDESFQMSRGWALKAYAGSLGVVAVYVFGYWLGLTDDTPTSPFVMFGVAASAPTFLFVLNLWRAAR